METSLFFEPVDTEKLGLLQKTEKNRLGDYITLVHPDEAGEILQQTDIALIGVNEDRQSVSNQGCANAPDEVRRQLYNLFPVHKNLTMVDLGNIRQGEKVSDTYFALKSVLVELFRANVIPIILGGSHDLTYPAYLAYESVKRIINLMTIDARIDLGKNDELPDAQTYLSNIILRKPNFLFNYTNIGYQTYLVDKEDIKLLNNLFFDAYRLGEIRTDLTEAEPVIRNTDLLTVDMSAVRQSDAPGNPNASPNGFHGEEICQLMRYAGLADRLSCIGFFEMNPQNDRQSQTAKLISQMIWYFLEGFTLRQHDNPAEDSDSFIKYYVGLPGQEDDIIFFKSKNTDRWWMQLPVSEEKRSVLSRHVMVPCSYNDYLLAGNKEIPDRWWKAYQKLM